MMKRTGIYLREQDEEVGPFHTRHDAECFLILMELSGVSSEGIDIVEIDTAELTERQPRSFSVRMPPEKSFHKPR